VSLAMFAEVFGCAVPIMKDVTEPELDIETLGG
jgi:hypothetical protein